LTIEQLLSQNPVVPVLTVQDAGNDHSDFKDYLALDCVIMVRGSRMNPADAIRRGISIELLNWLATR
jgi:2-keto-3-deoxy-6-phosphogluconate aldolase